MSLPADPHVTFIDAAAAWTVAPELLAALPPAVAGACDRLPALKSCAPGSSGPYSRPPGHRRAFYVEVPGAGRVAVKGTEVYCDDFADSIRALDESRVWVECVTGPVAHDVVAMSAELRGLEKWPLLEGKIPGAVTLPEALAEADAAQALQRAHLGRYGVPARAPYPLAVFRLPESAGERALAALSPSLSPRARDIVSHLARHGLAAYLYHYPGVPLRVAHLRAPELALGLSRGALRRRLEALGTDVPLVVNRWVELLARMLAVGLLPTDPRSVLAGNCLQIQNATLDGGFVDVGSLYPMADVRDERELRDALRRAVAELAQTILCLHVGSFASTRELRRRLPDVYAAVQEGVAAHLRADPGPLDPRLRAALLEPTTVADAVARILLAFDEP